ncbi:hypothetical protein HRR83_001985 [Exophiala dermatitidis]|uniref:DUF8035 domain-containing protein n=2 Tax=Exophiala dermatitidis TaxID=5970 RepID=H6BZ75_EXODN|nr:uncharacterized protein HMPREF1120_05002 [Exophiala dermatitidis NIH/UT8656]KAJ4514367.1 hypothetical protein HRR73_005393 [Exophiala dermatitidis]EHY56938.1 hypothetical protein HMPREF1120_05002 [Exophiala dermatitidis NIH/UT8656]KAJ4520029.1 hypothetical protein HRR75_001892 [Exophiala dermatitidis]KAJ4523867.1 hypothetical protein HRR74_002062 [Exophiala dermatitidis]KAJ4537193.1 hypothetical protein HRR76_005206 [Exophiala dermatitidis]
MAGRRYDDDISIDRYEDRREYSSRGGRRVYDDRYTEEERDYRRSTPVLREREREREVLVRDDVRERPRSGLDFLQDGYGRTSAGPVVLSKREREDFEFAPRPRRRSPSPETERKFEKEEIIVRKRDDSISRPPTRLRERDRDYERDEVIIRRDERERDRRLPPPTRDRERDEIIIRRDERERERDRDFRPPPAREQNSSREEILIRRDEGDRRVRYEADYDRDDVVSRRGDYARSARGDVDREEVIIRREEQNLSPRYDDYALSRPKSHERARSRSRPRRSSSASNQEIIIRQEEREGRAGTRDRQEIIIRKNSRSRSPSPSVASAPAAPPPPPEPQVINAPTIHQEVITHHRHIDHGFEVAIPTRPRVISRPPSPPSPPPPPPPAPRARSEERIQISRTQTRNGQTSAEDIVIDRNEGPAAPRGLAPYSPPPPRDPYYDPIPARHDYSYDRDVQEEAEYYNRRAVERSYVGEGYHGATRDWAIVDVPPGTRRVRMDGAGGGSQEITWQRYNGVRRSKFIPDGVPDDAYPSEIGRPAPLPAPMPAPAPVPAANGEIGRRYGRERDPTEGLWTEITKDLVVKEAIQEMGYEFEETDDFYYIMSYLRYEDVARLVGLSEDIRKERRKRVKEIEWENRVLPPPPVVEEVPRPLAIEPPPPPRPRQPWDREEERYIEREIVYKGGRPPPPVGWRR